MSGELQTEQEHYHRWLEENRSLLEARRFQEAFFTKGYPFLSYEDVIWAPLCEELRECQVAVISSAGLYLKDSQEPFDAESITGDNSYRAFPAETPREALEIAHGHYDSTAARKDLNAVLPIDRLRELVAEGFIGGLTPTIYSFMGYQPDNWDVRARLAPEIAERVALDRADAALVLPV